MIKYSLTAAYFAVALSGVALVHGSEAGETFAAWGHGQVASFGTTSR